MLSKLRILKVTEGIRTLTQFWNSLMGKMVAKRRNPEINSLKRTRKIMLKVISIKMTKSERRRKRV